MKGIPSGNGQSANSAAASPRDARLGSGPAGGDEGAEHGSHTRSQTTVRLDSSSSALAVISAESDQVQLKVLEATAGLTLERAVRAWGNAVPDGDSPFRIATIAASVARSLERDGRGESDNEDSGQEDGSVDEGIVGPAVIDQGADGDCIDGVGNCTSPRDSQCEPATGDLLNSTVDTVSTFTLSSNRLASSSDGAASSSDSVRASSDRSTMSSGRPPVPAPPDSRRDPFGPCADPECLVCTGKASPPAASTELVIIRQSPTELLSFDADFSAQWSLLASMQTETIASAACEMQDGRESDSPGASAGTDADAECESDGEAETDSDRLDFPDFGLDTDMSVWISDNVPAEDVAETASILGLSIAKTYRHLGIAMTIIHGLPRFADRVRAGEFTMAHVQAAADLCRTVAFRYLPRIDEHLAERRADVTCDRLRTALRKFITVLQPAEDRSKTAAERRRVDFQTYKNGSACLSLIGPTDELYACYRRVEAMARAVRARRGAAFDLPPGVEIADERSIQALEYDILSRPQPRLCIRVRSIDPVTGVQTEREEPLLDDEGNLLFDIDSDGAIVMHDGQVAAIGAGGDGSLRAAASGVAGDAVGTDDSRRGSAFSASPLNGSRIIDSRVVIAMPTHHWWLYWQAGVVVTVPFLTVCGESDLPGVLPEGSPIPAETARRIAGYSSTMTRILTDPATGTPLDAKATTYRIPNNVRKTLVAKWAVCSVPGCTRKAVTSEIDHIIPFFHLDPLKGGLTRFGNLHPLCKRHHAIKTADRFRVRMLDTGTVEYEFRHGVTTRSRAPDQPIDVAHALEFSELCGLSPGEVTIPEHLIPPAKDTVEVPPDEDAVRERDDAIRRAEEAAERDRLLAECIARSIEVRRRKRLSDCLDWPNVTHQACLPPGSDPVTMKRLMPGKRESAYSIWRRRDEAGDEWTEPLDPFWESSRAWTATCVQWDHDEDDPPPF